MTRDPLTELADVVQDLVGPIRHTERYEVRHGRQVIHRTHRQVLPGYIQQLREATADHAIDIGFDGKPAFTSKPPVNLDAIDRYVTIQREIYSYWHVNGNTLEQDLRGLVGAIAEYDPPTQRHVAALAARWLTWCKVVTGWSSAAWRPNVACPHCDARNLRVRLDEGTAFCAACGDAWEPGTLGILAAQIAAGGTP